MKFDKIWGIDVCFIDNAVDCDDIIVKETFNYNDKIILLGVANVSTWHGFDRVINGLHEYYRGDNCCPEIIFNIVGDGVEIQHLRELTKELNLEHYINFLGMKDKEELDKLYNEAHIAVSSLGMHRIQMINGSTLKTKEYCARGIPFKLSYKEAKLLKEYEGSFYLTFDADESPINLRNVVDFYFSIEPSKIAGHMRSFAEKNFSWRNEMEMIVNK
jgi:glycosyltransferase involved in cell wall biosynthesis